jgi:hypothetical protein
MDGVLVDGPGLVVSKPVDSSWSEQYALCCLAALILMIGAGEGG